VAVCEDQCQAFLNTIVNIWRMTILMKRERCLKELSWPVLRNSISVCLAGLRETIKTSNRDSRAACCPVKCDVCCWETRETAT
jgi:hypothetical protein